MEMMVETFLNVLVFDHLIIKIWGLTKSVWIRVQFLVYILLNGSSVWFWAVDYKLNLEFCYFATACSLREEKESDLYVKLRCEWKKLYVSVYVFRIIQVLVVDNASDPGVTAKNIWIDVVTLREQLCLSFTDNGSGMTPNKLHKMLRCVKTPTPITPHIILFSISKGGEGESFFLFSVLGSQRKALVKAAISPSACTEMDLSRARCVWAATLWSSPRTAAVRA